MNCLHRAVVGAALLALAAGAQAQKAGAPVSGPAKVNAMTDRLLDRMIVLTDMHWHKGEYNHIIHLSRMILAADPQNVDVLSNAGWLLWSMDRDPEAIALYEKGAKDNPSSYYMFDELGRYYMERKKDYPRAVRYYEQAVTKKDCPATTLHGLAHAYERSGQLDKSLATWRRAVEMKNNPNREAARRNMERVAKRVQDGGR